MLVVQVVHHVVEPEPVDPVREVAVAVRIDPAQEIIGRPGADLGRGHVHRRDSGLRIGEAPGDGDPERPFLGLGVVGPMKDQEVAVRRLRIVQRRLEPGMVVGDVLKLLIEVELHAARVDRADEAAIIVHRPELGIDTLEVAGEIIVIEIRRVDRGQEDRRHAEPLQIRQALLDPFEIALAVAVAVAHRAGEDLVEDFMIEPGRAEWRSAREESGRERRAYELHAASRAKSGIRFQRIGATPPSSGGSKCAIRRFSGSGQSRNVLGFATLDGMSSPRMKPL